MKKAILVVGPPRSGASVVSHIISELGVNFGTHFAYPFEIKSLNDLNDKIFEFFGQQYTNIYWLPTKDSFNDTIIRRFEPRIKNFILNEFEDNWLIGLKDPRFCYTLPLWHTILDSLGFDITYILVRRAANSIFESNRKINQNSASTIYNLVVQSTLLAHHFIADKQHYIVKYEDLFSKPDAIIQQIYNKIGLEDPDFPHKASKASSVIRRDLNHHIEKDDAISYHYFNLDAESISPVEIMRYRELMLNANDNQKRELNELQNQIIVLNQIIFDFQNSLSWRLMRPARFIGRKLKIRRVKKIISHLMFRKHYQTFKKLILIARHVITNDNLDQYLRLLDSPHHRQEMAQLTGLSPSLLNKLYKLYNQYLRFKRWLDVKLLKKKKFADVFALLAGEKVIATNKIKNQIQFYLEHPRGLIKLVNNTCLLSGWCINTIAHRPANVRIKLGKTIQQTVPIPRDEIAHSLGLLNNESEEVGFATELNISNGLHRLRIEVEVTKDNWVSVHRALLIRFPQFWFKAKSKKMTYQKWCDFEQKQFAAELGEIKLHMEEMFEKPFFTIVIDASDGNTGHNLTLKSIQAQIYQHYEILLYDPRQNSLANESLKVIHTLNFSEITGDFIVFIQNGQCLAKNTLYQFANALNQDATMDLIYGDEDDIDANGMRTNPFYKPDWSPDYLEVFNYISFPACFRVNIARTCFVYSSFYDFVLRFTERTANIHHIAMVLGHKPSNHQLNKELLDKIQLTNTAALEARLERTGREGIVTQHPLYNGCYVVKQKLKNKPLVSIIIPTAGKYLRINNEKKDLIINIVKQIGESSYDNLEIIIVDNGDLSPQQTEVLDTHGCKRITYKEPLFNISKKFNLGASIALGDYFLLLNDDTEILSPYWIERMLAHFEKPHVGVVGAKLLYPNHKTQHVGVVQNESGLYHVSQRHRRNEAGYYFSACGARNYIAVTGAVMLTLADLYRSVGGYSEELAVSFNDVDFCFKIRKKGYFIVYAPEVELIHMESVSRVPVPDVNEVFLFQKKWAKDMITDPFYNEQFLSIAPPTFDPCINVRKI